MPIEAALTAFGAIIFVMVFLLSEGSGRAIAIAVFIAGILVSTSGFAETVRDLIAQIVA